MTQGPESLPRQTASPSQAPPPARWGQSQQGPTPPEPGHQMPQPQQALSPVPRTRRGCLSSTGQSWRWLLVGP